MALAVIPARMASTRFPGKMLADRTGKPLIVHVLERARMARSLSRVLVATDDERIRDAVHAAGGHALMTHADHPNGTSRIAQVVRALIDAGDAGDADIVVNVQGDEPEIEPSVIDALVARLSDEAPESAGGAPMATLASDFAPGEDPDDPNVVKLVLTASGHALYFSRARVPYVRDAADRDRAAGLCLKHPGLYAYRRDFLLRYVTLAPTPLEQAEKLEQLRVLEHGVRIAVARVACRHQGIDTPEQYDAFVRRHRAAR